MNPAGGWNTKQSILPSCIARLSERPYGAVIAVFRRSLTNLHSNNLDVPNSASISKEKLLIITLILLTWRIWWAPNNASMWQMGFNLAFKELSSFQLDMFSELCRKSQRLISWNCSGMKQDIRNMKCEIWGQSRQNRSTCICHHEHMNSAKDKMINIFRGRFLVTRSCKFPLSRDAQITPTHPSSSIWTEGGITDVSVAAAPGDSLPFHYNLNLVLHLISYTLQFSYKVEIFYMM